MGCVVDKDEQYPPEHNIICDQPVLFRKKIARLKIDPSGSHRPFPFLFVAIHHRKLRMVHCLLNCGADVNLPLIPTGDTPLHAAARLPADQCESFVSGLLGAGAKPNTQNISGLTPLHIAIEEKNGKYSIT